MSSWLFFGAGTRRKMMKMKMKMKRRRRYVDQEMAVLLYEVVWEWLEKVLKLWLSKRQVFPRR
jgi:hypothetical protein